jgi:hypothetical protein
MNEHLPQESQFESDFNLEDEYTPEPLAPAGTYRGHVTAVTFDPAQQAIVWQVVLQGNGSYMSDGKTPIDGSRHYFRNWLPRPGDENIMTPSGRSTKRTAKINMMTKFAEGMEISMNTKDAIIKGITEGEWLGIPVFAKLSLNTYQGNTRNQIDSMTRDYTGDIIEVTRDDDTLPF